MGAHDSATSPTLLGHLRRCPDDQAAWGRFVERYGRRVYAWARHWGLQDADARDVAQSVFLDVARQMASFEYRAGGSFRAWLKTIAHRAWCDSVRARTRAAALGPEWLETIARPEAGGDLLRRLEEEDERELVEWAAARVRLRVEPRTWRAFELTAVEGRSGAEAAAELGMSVGAVYVARGKVQKMLREEVGRVERGGE